VSQSNDKTIHVFLEGDDCGWIVALDRRFKFLCFDGSPQGRTWRPVEVSWISLEREAEFGPRDFASGFGQWNMTDRARQILEPDLTRYGEFLPLKCGEETFWTFNVTNFVDALDVAASDILWASDDGHLLLVHEPAFYSERLTDDLMFKVPNWRTGSIYVSEQFVQLIRGHGLTGLRFRRVWPRLPEGRAPWTD
jgi:hypothetical protein